MRRLLDSDLELLVESDFIYLPLLLDPDIEKETKKLFGSTSDREGYEHFNTDHIIKHRDCLFVKTISIKSLIKHFDALNPYYYNRLKSHCLEKYQLSGETDAIFLDETLELILFHIMPHFVRVRRGLRRKKPDKEGILDLIKERVDVPQSYYRDALRFINVEALNRVYQDLENHRPIFNPPENGLWRAQELKEWLHEAIQARILADAHNRVKKTLEVRRQLTHTKPEHIAIYFYIADKGAIEIDNFGFYKMKSYKEYWIYKRTGQYVLKDYYGRSYLFPDCRVAVSTYYTPLKPFVIEKYKHPFLRGQQAGQEICLTGFEAPDELTADAVIQTLEEGITALLYGYDARRRNGYHSLDKTFVHIPTITFEDYRL